MNNKSIFQTLSNDPRKSNVLDANKLAHLVQLERNALKHTRAKTKQTKPTVQMSIRMEEGEYLRFRALCKAERRTNGDMVQLLIEFYQKELQYLFLVAR
jgi:hypothetical protein